jgi:hypothetical protein
MIHATIDSMLTAMYFSFLEVEEKPDGSYHALVFIKNVNSTGVVIGELFSKLRLTKANNGDITLAVANIESDTGAADTAAAARAATTFNTQTFTLIK